MTPQSVAEKLAKLLQKLSLSKLITVDDIKEIIWINYKTFCKSLRNELRLQPLLEESYSTPEKMLYSRIDNILFSRILTLFGCVKMETKQIDKWNTAITRFRLTKIGLAMFQES